MIKSELLKEKTRKFGISLGSKCMLKCRHCVISAAERGQSLTLEEIYSLQKAVQTHSPEEILFTGGEPTLYIREINEILLAHPDLKKCNVVITTNGQFAVTEMECKRVLDSIRALTHLQMSYDVFHAEFVPIANMKRLYKEVRKRKIRFSVLSSIETPLDLRLLKEIKKIGKFKVGIQKVVPFGEAEKNKVGFRFPGFDTVVLKKKCPNPGMMGYVCGKGFSWCCSEVVFRNTGMRFAHDTPEEHLDSPFYKLIAKNTFAVLMRKLGISAKTIRPEHSDQCVICSHIFNLAAKNGALAKLF